MTARFFLKAMTIRRPEEEPTNCRKNCRTKLKKIGMVFA